MPRLMSVAFTEAAVRARTKTVTRRKAWLFLKPGDRLTLCRKVMGRKPGEPLVRICDVEVVSVRREPLCAVAGPYRDDGSGGVIWPELIAEGFPDLGPGEFMRRYFEPQGIGSMDDVTRIEWRYIGAESPEQWFTRTGHCHGCGQPGDWCQCGPRTSCGCSGLHVIGSGIGRDPADVFAEAAPVVVEQEGMF